VARDRLSEGVPLFELLQEAGMAASGGEARRLIKGGGARVNDAKVADQNQTVTLADVSDEGVVKVSAGKKRHALVKPV
jgi:tyrosyl-tRNA synthetase